MGSRHVTRPNTETHLPYDQVAHFQHLDTMYRDTLYRGAFKPLL